jgi:hypothetical protein
MGFTLVVEIAESDSDNESVIMDRKLFLCSITQEMSHAEFYIEDSEKLVKDLAFSLIEKEEERPASN